MKSFIIFLLTSACLAVAGFAAQPLVELRACKFVPTEWADGDSFQIETVDGTSQTIRLYGADCIEWHVNDKSDATRLAEQRHFFGISAFGGSAKTSIEAAKATGQSAAMEAARALSKPFTVHTAYADARGDGKNKRIYAFVTTADGQDLAERLVRMGLARAFGVYRETPGGKSAKDYQEFLRDVELVAAKAGTGVWAKTNWDRLSAERQEQRMADAELELASGSGKATADLKMDPNTAARDELMKLPGVGEVTANRIISGRPYKTLADLRNVEGLGSKTLEKLTPYLLLPGAK
jgi:competence protein ComEA